MGAAPQIGIYWLHGGKVIGLACALAQAEPGIPEILDSPFTHVEAWPRIRAAAGLPPALEYDELPRGRVLFASGPQTSIVYGDRALIGAPRGRVSSPALKCRAAIMAFFSLSAVRVAWRHDDHYTVGWERIDPLLDE